MNYERILQSQSYLMAYNSDTKSKKDTEQKQSQSYEHLLTPDYQSIDKKK